MFMKAKDAISGKEGSVIAVIDGKVVEVAELKNLTATITKNKVEFKALGNRGTQHKATGWSGSGSATLYYANSAWAKMMVDYAKSGVDTYFSILVTNEDPTSSIGLQRVKLIDCNIDEIDVAKIDVDADFLDQSVNFTFSDVDILDEFKPLG